MPDRPSNRAISVTSAARETPAPRRLNVERSITVRALTPDAPVEGDAVGVIVAAADAVLALTAPEAGDVVLDGGLLAV